MSRRSQILTKGSCGFSVVELMVAVTLSLILLGGVVAMFANSRKAYETTDKVSLIQETGQFALDQISRDIRAAGYVGCARAPTYISSSLNNSASMIWNFLDGPVRGFQSSGAGAWTPALDASVTNAASGSDVLVLRIPAREAQPLRVTTAMSNGQDNIQVENVSGGLKAGDVALAYSCEAQAYFQVTSFSGGTITHTTAAGTPGNATDNISYAFRENAEVIPVQTVIYYVRASQNIPGLNSLWRKSGANAAEELVEGVEQMQLQFGVDTTGDSVVDQYRTANNVTNWANVYSITAALLVRSLESYGNDLDNREYQLLDVNVPAAADRHLRQAFVVTANLRNRVPVN